MKATFPAKHPLPRQPREHIAISASQILGTPFIMKPVPCATGIGGSASSFSGKLARLGSYSGAVHQFPERACRPLLSQARAIASGKTGALMSQGWLLRQKTACKALVEAVQRTLARLVLIPKTRFLEVTHA